MQWGKAGENPGGFKTAATYRRKWLIFSSVSDPGNHDKAWVTKGALLKD